MDRFKKDMLIVDMCTAKLDEYNKLPWWKYLSWHRARQFSYYVAVALRILKDWGEDDTKRINESSRRLRD
jgi:hypothetical protein